MERMNRSTLLSLMLLWVTSGPTSAAVINFSGQLGFVQETVPGTIYYGTPIGTLFSGFIDDTSGVGQISNGTTLTTFGADGVSVDNDVTLDALDVSILNTLLGSAIYSIGDVVDIIDIEGDKPTSNGGFIEFGISYIFDKSTFDNDSLSNYPFDPNDVLLSCFYINEENALGEEIYNAAGILNAVPIPAALPLLGSALSLFGFMGWRRKV